MNLGAQYYRAPFPNARYWDDDFRRMRDAGLNTVQLWVLWGWVEATPGRFDFDDYDRLVDLAAKNDLRVVLSTIAEIQPPWIEREIPGCALVDSDGRPVASVNRGETHFGVTPGGCTDHPEVWGRMRAFLETVGERYRSAPNLVGWDAWNELRWNVHADARVCYCEHTLRAFRRWLDERHGGLDGLNAAWVRRYADWADVQPGRKPNTPYTEHMAFGHFLTHRADVHARARYEVLKGLDPDRLVTVHGPAPSIQIGGSPTNHALNRGNDWFMADACDGVGTSSFPKWFGLDDADFGVRVEAVRSAARGKAVWLSEVQGGRASAGFDVHEPVDPRSQQRWIWNGLACGADTILFWCWRDEVFGRESAGFGLSGADGLAEARLAAMRETGRALEAHADLLAAYRPDEAEVGLMFSPQSYYLHWAREGSAWRAADSLQGYAKALTRRSVPYRFVEEAHLDDLAGLKLLILPRCLVTDAAQEEALAAFVRGGGTLLVESECGAFGSNGLYRYPEDRFLAALTGSAEIGRRTLAEPSVRVTLGGEVFDIPAAQWLTPWPRDAGTVLADGKDGALMVALPAGEGRVVASATYFGESYWKAPTAALEGFLAGLADEAGAVPPVRALEPETTDDAFVYLRTGSAGAERLVFVFFPEGAPRVRLALAPDVFTKGTARDLVTGGTVSVEEAGGSRDLTLEAPPMGYAVLAG